MEMRVLKLNEIRNVHRAANALGILPLAFFLLALACYFYDGDPTIEKFPSWKYLVLFLSGVVLEFYAHLRLMRFPVFSDPKPRNLAQGMLAVWLLWLLSLAEWFGAFFHGGVGVDLLCVPPVVLKVFWILPFLLFLNAISRLTQSRLASLVVWGGLLGFFGGIVAGIVFKRELFALSGFFFSVFCLTCLLPLLLCLSLRKFARERAAEPASGMALSIGKPEDGSWALSSSVWESEAGRVRLSELTLEEIRGLKLASLGIALLLASAACMLWCAVTFFTAHDVEFARKLIRWGFPGAYFLLLMGGSLLCAVPKRFRMKFRSVLLFGIFLAAIAEFVGLQMMEIHLESLVGGGVLLVGGSLFFGVSLTFFVSHLLRMAERMTIGSEAVFYGKCRASVEISNGGVLIGFLFGLGIMKVGPVFSMVAFLLWGGMAIWMLLSLRDVLLRFLDGEIMA